VLALKRRLDARPLRMRIARNAGWLLTDRVSRVGVGLFTGLLVARYLGPQQFGVFSYVTAFAALFAVFATLGLTDLVVRVLVQEPEDRDETLGTVFTLRFLAASLALSIATVSVFLLRPHDATAHYLVPVAAAGMLFQSADTIDFWFQSKLQSKFTVYAKLVPFFVASAAKIGLVVVHAPLPAFVWASLAEQSMAAVGMFVVYKSRRLSIRNWSFSLQRAQRLLAQSWPLILTGVAITVYMRIDIIMIGQFSGARSTGLYSAATRISEVWYFLPTVIVTSAFPVIVEVKRRSEAEYYEKLESMFHFLMALGLAIAVPMTVLSGPLVALLYGGRYVQAGTILAIHIWTSLFVFLGVGQGPWTITEGLTRLILFRTSAGALVNVGLNVFLIPLYGGIGAATATVIAQSFAAFFLNAFDKRTRRIFFCQLRALFLFNYWHRLLLA